MLSYYTFYTPLDVQPLRGSWLTLLLRVKVVLINIIMTIFRILINDNSSNNNDTDNGTNNDPARAGLPPALLLARRAQGTPTLPTKIIPTKIA